MNTTWHKSVICSFLMSVGCLPFARAEAPPYEQELLGKVIENVKLNECLYDNIDVRWTIACRHEENLGLLPMVIMNSQSEHRCILQREMEYDESKASGSLRDRKSYEKADKYGYDGANTRMVVGQFGNVIHGRREWEGSFRPHTWLLTRTGVRFPLSVLLAGGNGLSNHPHAGNYRNLTVKSKVEAQERVENLDCVKIRQERWTKDREPTLLAVVQIWLALQRNYLPVKAIGYHLGFSDKIPLEVYVAEDFREIRPGVWIPFRGKVTVNDETDARNGNEVLSNTEELVMREVKIDPSYDVSVFRDIEFPPGTQVFEVEKDEITHGYRIPTTSERFRSLWLAVAIAFAVAICCYLAIRRRRKQMAQRQLQMRGAV